MKHNNHAALFHTTKEYRLQAGKKYCKNIKLIHCIQSLLKSHGNFCEEHTEMFPLCHITQISFAFSYPKLLSHLVTRREN